jgi:type I restriction enzyme, S subunit
MSRYLLFLSIERPIKRLEETIVGTTVAHLSARDLKEMKVLLPSPKILATVTEFLEPIYSLEMDLRRKNANLRAQRDLLLPKLVSGEIDVSEVAEPDDGAAAA